MASIIKRKKSYSVVYNYIDENGDTKQKWETWHTHKEALKRKAEVENQQNSGTFLPPNNQKISEFLYDFVCTYGEKKWGVSMYDSQTALIANYINPIIGDMAVQDVTPRVVDKYIQTLQKNIALFETDSKSIEILRADILNLPRAKNTFDIVFSDAPYDQGLNEKALQNLALKGFLKNGALCIVETRKNESLSLPETFHLEDERTYGMAKIRFYTFVA